MHASWWLKVERAEKHLAELKQAINDYAISKPYESVGGTKAEHDRLDVVYSLRITQPPDAEIAAIVGDVVHNARSALDHIAVALAPRERNRDAAFPVATEDLWLKVGRRYRTRSPGARRSYRAKVEGMAPGAQAIIKAAQPYRQGAEAESLAILNRLENADKHERLIITASVLTDPGLSAYVPGIGQFSVSYPGPYQGLTEEMQLTLYYPKPDLPMRPLRAETVQFFENHTELEVEPSAAVSVSVQTRENSAYLDAIATLEIAVGAVSRILRDLEPFVQRANEPRRARRTNPRVSDIQLKA